MSYRGTVKEGVVVFDGPRPPDGTTVEVAEAAVAAEVANNELTKQQRAERLTRELLALAETMEQELPTDASLNVDHYLYGHPKR